MAAMSSETFVPQDFHREGVQAKRDHDHKAKLAYRARTAQPQEPLHGSDLSVIRPAAPVSHYMLYSRALKRDNQKSLNHLAADAKANLRLDLKEVLDEHHQSSDSSGDEDIKEPTSANENVLVDRAEEDPFHPYDVSGQTILSAAINKAIERYETKETERIVKEYEFVPHEGEPAGGFLADGDFELVDHVQL
jgi:hypothetical protein